MDFVFYLRSYHARSARPSMKKKYIIPLVALLAVLSTQAVYSMNITLGMNAFYAMWAPAWGNVNGSFTSDPLLMWGPSASLSFDNGFTISVLYLQNSTNPSKARNEVQGSGHLGRYTMVLDTTIERGEIDLTAGYRLMDGLRIFAGFKNMFYNEGGRRGSTDASIDMFGPYTVGSIDALYADNIGAGMGLMYYRQVLANTIFSFVVSVIYMESTIQTNSYKELGTTGVIDSVSENDKYRAVGGNTSFSISYYFPGTGIMLSLGGRYQQLKYIPVDNGNTLEYDIYYGLMVSAGYTF